PERIASRQLVTEVGMGEPDERTSPLEVAEDRQIGGAVLRDDPLHVMARRGDGRIGAEPWHDGGDPAALHHRGRLEAEPAPPARRLGPPPAERFGTPHAPELASADVVRSDLAEEGDGQ